MGSRDWISKTRSRPNGDDTGGNSADDPVDDRSRPYATIAAELSPNHTDDVEALRAVRDEARDSLNKTIEAIEEKDDKAISTVRLNLLLIGIVITAASSLPSSLHYANWFTLTGVLLLTISTFIGMWAYTYTDYTPGITSDYIEELERERYTEQEWLRWMNQRYQQWIQTATRSESIEATKLGRTHVLQIIGVALLILGATAGLYGMERAPIVPSEPPTDQTPGNAERPDQSPESHTRQPNDAEPSLRSKVPSDAVLTHPQDSYRCTHKISL